MRTGGEERDKFQLRVPDDAQQHFPVEVAQEEDAQLTALGADIFDDVIGAAFPEGELILILPVFPDQIDEGAGDHCIVLGRQGKTGARGAEFILLFQQVGLFHHLPGIGQEFDPVRGEHDAPAAPVKDGDAHLLFQIGNRFGKAGLGDEEPLAARLMEPDWAISMM